MKDKTRKVLLEGHSANLPDHEARPCRGCIHSLKWHAGPAKSSKLDTPALTDPYIDIGEFIFF